MNRFYLLMTLFTGLLLTGCGFGGGGAAGPGISGVWSGELVDTINNQAHPMQLTLIDSGGTVTGSYECAIGGNLNCPLNVTLPTTVSLVGEVIGDTFTFQIVDTDSNNTCQFIAQFSDPFMVGQYSCAAGQETGTWNVQKL